MGAEAIVLPREGFNELRPGRLDILQTALGLVRSGLQRWKNNPMPLVTDLLNTLRQKRYVGELEPLQRWFDYADLGRGPSIGGADMLKTDLEGFGLNENMAEDLARLYLSGEMDSKSLERIGRLLRVSRSIVEKVVPVAVRSQFEEVLDRTMALVVSVAKEQGGGRSLPDPFGKDVSPAEPSPGGKKPKKSTDKRGKKEEGLQEHDWSRYKKARGCTALVAVLFAACVSGPAVCNFLGKASALKEVLISEYQGEWERAEALNLHKQYPDVTHAGVENADTRLTNILSGAEPESDEMMGFDLGTFDNAGNYESAGLSGRQLSMALGWHDALVEVGLINQDGRLDASEQSRVINKLRQLGVSQTVAEQFWQRFSWSYDHFDDYGIEANREQQGLGSQQQQVMVDVRMNSFRSKQQEMKRRGVGRTSLADTGLLHRGSRRS